MSKGRGMGSVTRLPSGSWRGVIYIAGRQERKTYPTREMALRWLREMRLRKVEEESGAVERRTVDQTVTYGALAARLLEWMASGSDRVHTQRTLESYRQQVKQMLTEWRDRRIARTKTRDIEAWKVKLRSEGYSTSTIRHRLDALSKFHKFAVAMAYLPRVPTEIKRPRLVCRSERDAVSEQEMAALVSAAKGLIDPRPLAVILLAGDAGLRASEICRLRWSDTREGYIHVAVRGEQDRTKSGRSRDVPILTVRLREALEALPHSDIGLVVSGCQTRWSVRRLVLSPWRAILGGSPQAHRLRHRFASRCANLGVPAFKLMRWMGHATLDVTQRYYHDDFAVDRWVGSGLECAPGVPRQNATQEEKQTKLLENQPDRGVAQLAEHRSPKPGVAGSIPVSPAIPGPTPAAMGFRGKGPAGPRTAVRERSWASLRRSS
jgi:integrase